MRKGARAAIPVAARARVRRRCQGSGGAERSGAGGSRRIGGGKPRGTVVRVGVLGREGHGR